MAASVCIFTPSVPPPSCRNVRRLGFSQDCADILCKAMNPDTIHALEIVAIVVAGTMTGNEIAVAVFFHPRISRWRTLCMSEPLKRWLAPSGQ
jgi:hypothetical protein